MEWESLEDYISSINALKKKYEGIIEIHLGLETEYSKTALEERKELKGMVEYLLLGQHFDDPSNRNFSVFRKNTDEEILEYARLVCEGIDSGLFTYLAHPDVIMNGQEEFTQACEKAAHMIGKKAQETGIPLEINCHGIGKGRKPFPDGDMYYYPNRDFWSILAQYEIKGIVGIDAHDPRDLLDTEAVEEGLRELADLDIEIIENPFR